MWLSQYLYSPLCHLEIVDTPRVVDHGGRKLSLLRMRLTVNQRGKTLEQIDRSRKDFIHQLATSMQWRVRDWARKHELLTRLQLTIHQLDCAVGEVVDAAPPSALNANDSFESVLNKLFDRVDEEGIKIAEALWQDGEAAQAEGKTTQARQLFRQAMDARDGRDATGLCQDKEAGRSRVAAMQAHVVAMQEVEGLGRAEQIQLAQDSERLAKSLFEKGEYEKALIHFGKAEKLRLAVFGRMHPDVTSTRNNIAVIYEQQGKYEEALQMYQQAQEVYLAVYGEGHPDVATTRFNLGQTLVKMNKTSDAKKMFREAAVIFLQCLGPDHPRTKAAQRNSALINE